MAIASFGPFISRRLPPLLQPFLMSPRPPARHCSFFFGDLLQLHRHSSSASSSSCPQQPQLVPGPDAEEEAGPQQQGKKVWSAVGRRQSAAAPRAPRPSAPKKPKKGQPAKPGGPKEGSGGNGGVVHDAPAYSSTSSSSSSSRGDDKKVE